MVFLQELVTELLGNAKTDALDFSIYEVMNSANLHTKTHTLLINYQYFDCCCTSNFIYRITLSLTSQW